MRCFVSPLGVESEDNYWHRWYKKYGRPQQLDQWLDELGTQANSEDWRPSVKQAKSIGWSSDKRASLTSEVVCSSHVLLLHLLDWSSRLRGGRRDIAAAMGADFMQKVLSSLHEDLPDTMASMPKFDPELCRKRARDSGYRLLPPLCGQRVPAWPSSANDESL